MTEPRILKLLVIEDDLDDQAFLREALVEIEERLQWCSWQSASIVPVEHLSDALDCLRQDWFDTILLNLSLPDSPVLLESFLEVAACARGTPIVVLADDEDENLANRLLREGAQDILFKGELECAPLARSLRYAIERQRRTNAIHSSSFVDSLTGTLTRRGFLTAAEHYRQLSRHNRLNLLFSTIDIGDFAEPTPADRDRRELLLIRTAEVLRNEFPEPAMIGRMDRWCFGLITAGLAESRVESLLSQAVRQLAEPGLGRPKQMANVSYSSAELFPGDNLEELLSDTTGFAPAAPRGRKKVMLAD